MIPTVCDHLWQSTLFACGAGLLALALRRHSARALLAFNPRDFDKFVGYYRFGESANFAHVYRAGDRYYSQLTGQPPVEFFPESPTEFFTTVVAAQMSFVFGPNGQVTEMVIHQNGNLHPLQRVSKAVFDAASARLAERIKDNTPSPGTREMVLTYIKDLEPGGAQPYDTMTPELERSESADSAPVRR